MNLKDHAAQDTTAPLHYRQPFRIEADGTSWACACDMTAVVFVKADLKVPAFRGTEADLASLVNWVTSEPNLSEKASLTDLLEWSVKEAEKPTTILGVQLDRRKLAKLLHGIKGEVRLWTGEALVGLPSLFIDRGGVWRCLLAGYDEVDPTTPVFDKFTQASLFDIAMGG